MTQLGTLEKVNLRDIWPNEATDFTPWLAQEENLNILGTTLGGIELELQGTEQSVGSFSADILCKDTADDTYVLIENQLEKTNHTHLGQILTYAAGLNTVTIVWICQRFTDEHRAAFDWLNRITSEEFQFFGLELELWRIGDSDPAPKFNMVSEPNDWTKSLNAVRKNPTSLNQFSELKQKWYHYWADFGTFMDGQTGSVKARKPRPQHWMNFAVGRSKFRLTVELNSQENRIRTSLWIAADNAKGFFDALNEDKAIIETELGEPLNWERLNEGLHCRISISLKDVDPTDETQWSTQHAWIKEKLEKLHTVFSPRLKGLEPLNLEDELDEEQD